MIWREKNILPGDVSESRKVIGPFGDRRMNEMLDKYLTYLGEKVCFLNL